MKFAYNYVPWPSRNNWKVAKAMKILLYICTVIQYKQSWQRNCSTYLIDSEKCKNQKTFSIARLNVGSTLAQHIVWELISFLSSILSPSPVSDSPLEVGLRVGLDEGVDGTHSARGSVWGSGGVGGGGGTVWWWGVSPHSELLNF